MFLFQAPDARLTLTRVATAPVLIAEVARATGQRLEVSPVLSTEVLVVSVQDARVADVLARLATAATAVWQPTEGGYRLVPDRAARGIEARAERARRLQAIVEAQRKKATDAAKAKKGNDAGAAFAGAFGGSHAIDAFVPLLDLDSLAAMEAGDRLVFSTNPTAAQRPLRGDPDGIVADLIAEHNRGAEQASASLNAIPEGMDAMLKGPLGDRMRRASRRIDGAPAKVLVVASRGAMPIFGGTGIGIRLEVRAYAADGSVMIEETGSVDGGFMDAIAAFTAPKPTPTAGPSTPIAYSEEAKTLIELTATPERGMTVNLTGGGTTMQGAGGKPRLTPTLRAILMDPAKHDPLALIPGEGLVALAKARRKPLVACLPDAAYPSITGTPAPKTVEEVEKSLESGPMRRVPDTAFLVVKAAEPETARETRLDRGALTTLLREVADHESPTLDELSDYAARTPTPFRNPVSLSTLTLFAPETMSSMSGVVSWEALRLYASLSPAQRESLAGGAKLPFNTISGAGLEALGAMLYGADGSVTVERAGATTEPDLFAMGLKMALGGGDVDARDEPTEIAPSGLPAGGYLQASVATEPIIRPLTSDGPGPSVVSADELAMVHLMSGSPLGAQVEDAMRLPDTGRLGTRTVWNLRGYVAAKACVTATLDDDRTPKDGATVNLASLPQEFQSRVDQRTEKLKNSPLGAILSMAASMKKGGVKGP